MRLSEAPLTTLCRERIRRKAVIQECMSIIDICTDISSILKLQYFNSEIKDKAVNGIKILHVTGEKYS
jgi:hypothetical protein